MKKYLLLILLIILITGLKAQDKVELTDGKILSGKITLVDKEKVAISTASKIYECPLVQVKFFERDGIVYDPSKLSIESNKIFGSSAGDELIKSATAFYTGTVLMFIGSATSTFGSYSYAGEKKNSGKYLMFGGAGLSLVGMIVQLSSFGYIAKAGKKLNLSGSENGLTLNYKF